MGRTYKKDYVKKSVKEKTSFFNKPVNLNNPFLIFLLILFLILILLPILYFYSLSTIKTSVISSVPTIPNPLSIKSKTTLSKNTPTPTLISTYNIYASDFGSKIFETSIFSIKYPADLIIEERMPYFYVFALEKDIHIPLVGIAIDARFKDNASSYDKTVEESQKNLVNASVQKITNGIIVKGILGQGYGEGLHVQSAYIKYKNGALGIETIDGGGGTYSKLFDQVVSSLKLVN